MGCCGACQHPDVLVRQSVFGYISVLPGAFSAYRYKALKNLPNGKGPLASYFKGEAMHGGGATGAGLFGRPSALHNYSQLRLTVIISERNMYLAEDRILCFEIVTKKHEAWVYVEAALTQCRSISYDNCFRLRYVKSAKAATDVPTTVHNFQMIRFIVYADSC